MRHDAVGMSNRLLSLVAVLVTGCAFVPKDKVTMTVVGTRMGASVPLGGEVARLEVSSSASAVNVVARFERHCSRTVVETVQLRHEKTVGFWMAGGGGNVGGGGGPGDALFLLVGLAEVIVLPASLIITGIAVGTHDDVIETQERPAPSVTVPCPVGYPSLSLRAALPSGAEVELTTNEYGAARFDVPESEPAYGVVEVRGDALVGRTRYYRDLAACYAHRDEVLATGRWDELPQCGSSPEELATDAAWHATARAVGVAAGGRCDLALDFAVEALRTDANVYQTVFLRVPALAACVREHEHDVRERGAAHDACVSTRREQMLGAQRIQDMKARAAALSKLPICAPAR